MKKRFLFLVVIVFLSTSVLAADIAPEVLDVVAKDGTVDFFVVMREKADLVPAKQLQTKAEKGHFVFSVLKETATRSQQDIRVWLENQGISSRSYWIRNMIRVAGNRDILQSIADRQDVEKIIPNRRHQALDPWEQQHAYAADSAREVEWNLTQINADRVWTELGITGAGIVVCDNDTGVDWDHPALIEQYRGWNSTTADHNFNWKDCTTTASLEPFDDHGHGTHTTGTMIGDDGDVNQIGVAPGAKWIAVKNMDSEGNGEDAWFHDSFQWILAPTDLNGENPDPGRAPHVVNNSWGYFGGGDPQFYPDIEALNAAGIFVEVSAGNEGPDCGTLRSPPDYDNVFTTGSTRQGGFISGFSSRGPSALYPEIIKPEIVAPGSNIRSSTPGGNYQGGWSGTSMAGPHTCGMVALIWSANHELIGDIASTRTLIQNTAVYTDVSTCTESGGRYIPNNVYGWGEIDCLAAVNEILLPRSEGLLLLDKPAYMCLDSMEIVLKDSDLAGFESWMVSVSSNTETTPEIVILQSINDNGSFSGSIDIRIGTPAVDNILQVTEDDLISVVYEDADHGGMPQTVTGTADVDCTAPLITGIEVRGLSASTAKIIWTTDEAATTGLYYTDSGTPTDGVFHSRTSLNHEVQLTGLDSCTTYVYYVFSDDAAGNAAVDDNGGAYYSFETYKTVVMMDANMDTDPGWTTECQWEWGQPAGNAGDPSSGHTGANVYGYNLNGAYENNIPKYSLITTSIDCSGAVGTKISYAIWLNVEDYQSDQAGWDVSIDDGATWINLFDNSWFPGTMLMDSWYPIEAELGALVDGHSDVRFRWTMGPTNGTNVYGGWNIDDVQIIFDVDCDYVTPTPEPSPTPTIELGVRIDMPEMGHPGENFYVTGYLDNPDAPLSDVAVFFILDVYSHFWFWPTWAYYAPPEFTDIDYDVMDISTGSEAIMVIEEFTWPETGNQTAAGLYFYGAMLNDTMSAIRGNMADKEWGYGP